MKEWGKAFQVPVKSAQVCMVSPGKGDVNSGAAVRMGNSSGRRGWHGAGGARPQLPCRKEGSELPELLVFFKRTRNLRLVRDFLIFKY